MRRVKRHIVKIRKWAGTGLIVFAGFAFWYGKLDAMWLIIMVVVGCFLFGATNAVFDKLTFGLLKLDNSEK